MMMSTTSCYNNNTISTHRINDRVKSVMEKLRLIRESEYGTTTRNQIYENEEVVCEDNPMTMQEQIYEEEEVWKNNLLRNHRETIREMKRCNEVTAAKLPQPLRQKFEARRKRQLENLKRNGKVIDRLLNEHDHDASKMKERPSGESYDEVGLLLIQVAREWTLLGRDCRVRCSQDILKVCESIRRDCSGPLVAIVPGSGLGRLAFDIAIRGFDVTGIECSRMMISACRNILSMSRSNIQMDFYPFAIRTANSIGRSDETGIHLSSQFPDVHVKSVMDLTPHPYNSSLNILRGAFGTPDSSLFIKANSTDILATCFFVDCVPDLVNLVNEARRILKPGASWLNFGPLKYHGGGDRDRLTWNEFVELVSAFGFRIVSDKIRSNCLYIPYPLGSMDTRSGYNCGFFHAVLVA